jgi:methionyl-tRNA formyltransferase
MGLFMQIKPRVLVFAYHDVGYECLALLLARSVDVVTVFTHEDDPGEEIWFKSVMQLARARGVVVHAPRTINTPEWIARIEALRPDLVFSFYYRQLIPTEILEGASLGAYNMHGSLLPKYRGRAPVNWAVLRGECETGATLHVMVRRPDAGDIVDQEHVPIGPEETAREVFSKVTAAARTVLARQLDNLLAGRAPRRPQDEAQATYFGGRRPEDGRIDWRLAAPAVFNLVRAVTHPYPGAFTDVDGRRLIIWWARPQAGGQGVPGEVLSAAPLTIACGSGALEVSEWQWGHSTLRRDDTHGLLRGAVLGAPAAANVPGVQP